jgi:hypothetical protein
LPTTINLRITPYLRSLTNCLEPSTIGTNQIACETCLMNTVENYIHLIDLIGETKTTVVMTCMACKRGSLVFSVISYCNTEKNSGIEFWFMSKFVKGGGSQKQVEASQVKISRIWESCLIINFKCACVQPLAFPESPIDLNRFPGLPKV